LFIVSSKSGSTLEPNILKAYFHARITETIGAAKAGRHFVAITDPGSALERVANEEGFARLFHGDPEIGGRYSVLSCFGLVPAASIGLDGGALLDSAARMVESCRPEAPPEHNPGVRLGVMLGVLAAKHGRDKITIVSSPALASAGTWLEQLIAESTGKNGKGLIPIDGEGLAPPQAYGRDRVFLSLRLDDEDEPEGLAALAGAGHPVLRLVLHEREQIGQLFFLSQMAIAIAGAVIGINPFDQPDVEASKVKARALSDAAEQGGALPEEKPVKTFDGVALYAGKADQALFSGQASLAAVLKAHFGRAKPGDYAALLAFIEPTDKTRQLLQTMRTGLRDRLHIATCAEFGPRFLHSTGQAYKGGPDTGIFLTITAVPHRDMDVPGRRFSFGLVEQAQAQGDFSVLCGRGRRALRIHLDDRTSGMDGLAAALNEALG
jgi:transaldolase/glucose-6-phosphate isomerase